MKVENKGPPAPASRLGLFQYYMQAATASDVFPQTQCLGVGWVHLNTLEASDVIMSWVRLFSIPIKSQGVGCVQLNAWEQQGVSQRKLELILAKQRNPLVWELFMYKFGSHMSNFHMTSQKGSKIRDR